MITRAERTLAASMGQTFEAARTQWIARARVERGRIESALEWYVRQGFECVDVDAGTLMTADGREVLWVRGEAIALRPDVHTARLEAALAEAKRNAQGSKVPSQANEVSEGIAAATCPQMHAGKPCGGSLNRRPVCPSCVTGKMGYKYRYTCESCGCDIVTREELR